MDHHPDQGVVEDVLQAIGATRDNILKLRAALETEGECCA
jgi:hypothetical protein